MCVCGVCVCVCVCVCVFNQVFPLFAECISQKIYSHFSKANKRGFHLKIEIYTI